MNEIKNMNQNARKRKINENYFDVIDTEHKAYWLGFLMADGCIYKGSSKNSYRLQMNLSEKDKIVLENFLQDIESDYKIQDKLVANKYPSSLLKINSTKLCFSLINHGVTERKSLKSNFPSTIPVSIENHFIRGYFDGDGSISVYQRTDRNNLSIKFSICCGIDMATELQKRLYGIGIYKLRRNSNIAYVETGNKDTILNIYNYLYKDATVYLKRKKDIFDAIFKCPV